MWYHTVRWLRFSRGRLKEDKSNRWQRELLDCCPSRLSRFSRVLSWLFSFFSSPSLVRLSLPYHLLVYHWIYHTSYLTTLLSRHPYAVYTTAYFSRLPCRARNQLRRKWSLSRRSTGVLPVTMTMAETKNQMTHPRKKVLFWKTTMVNHSSSYLLRSDVQYGNSKGTLSLIFERYGQAMRCFFFILLARLFDGLGSSCFSLSLHDTHPIFLSLIHLWH